jgi:hypothetical protein
MAPLLLGASPPPSKVPRRPRYTDTTDALLSLQSWLSSLDWCLCDDEQVEGCSGAGHSPKATAGWNYKRIWHKAALLVLVTGSVDRRSAPGRVRRWCDGHERFQPPVRQGCHRRDLNVIMDRLCCSEGPGALRPPLLVAWALRRLE